MLKKNRLLNLLTKTFTYESLANLLYFLALPLLCPASNSTFCHLKSFFFTFCQHCDVLLQFILFFCCCPLHFLVLSKQIILHSLKFYWNEKLWKTKSFLCALAAAKLFFFRFQRKTTGPTKPQSRTKLTISSTLWHIWIISLFFFVT